MVDVLVEISVTVVEVDCDVEVVKLVDWLVLVVEVETLTVVLELSDWVVELDVDCETEVLELERVQDVDCDVEVVEVDRLMEVVRLVD